MPERYTVRLGTVQPYVAGFSDSPFIQHFGMPEYDRNRPILRDSLRERVEPIVADMNKGRISESEGRRRIKRLY